MDVVDLLRFALTQLDRREPDRAHVDCRNGQERHDHQPIEHGPHFGGTTCGGAPSRRRHSSSVKGNATVHAATKTMSKAMRIFNQWLTSETGRPAKIHADACAAFMSTGTKNGKLSIGSKSSASRVLTAIALNNVPIATMPIIARSTIPVTTSSGSPTGKL